MARKTDLALAQICPGATGTGCGNKAGPSGFCRSCAPTRVRDLYAKGLSAAQRASLMRLSQDPQMRSLGMEITRTRLMLDRAFERLTGIESAEEQMRMQLQSFAAGPVNELVQNALQNLEAIEGALQDQVEQIAGLMETLRRMVETHVKVQEGVRLTPTVTTGDLMAFLKMVVAQVRDVAGDEKGRIIAERIRGLTGRLDCGLPVPELEQIADAELSFEDA